MKDLLREDFRNQNFIFSIISFILGLVAMAMYFYDIYTQHSLTADLRMVMEFLFTISIGCLFIFTGFMIKIPGKLPHFNSIFFIVILAIIFFITNLLLPLIVN